jgi:hypothetical protein
MWIRLVSKNTRTDAKTNRMVVSLLVPKVTVDAVVDNIHHANALHGVKNARNAKDFTTLLTFVSQKNLQMCME